MAKISWGAVIGLAAGAAFLTQSITIESAWAGSAASTAPTRTSLGIMVAPVPPGAKGVLMLDRDRGMVVVGVVAGGLAERAGLHKGDVLLAIDGRAINREADLAAALSAASAAGQAVAQISRQGKVIDIAIAF